MHTRSTRPHMQSQMWTRTSSSLAWLAVRTARDTPPYSLLRLHCHQQQLVAVAAAAAAAAVAVAVAVIVVIILAVAVAVHMCPTVFAQCTAAC